MHNNTFLNAFWAYGEATDFRWQHFAGVGSPRCNMLHIPPRKRRCWQRLRLAANGQCLIAGHATLIAYAPNPWAIAPPTDRLEAALRRHGGNALAFVVRQWMRGRRDNGATFYDLTTPQTL